MSLHQKHPSVRLLLQLLLAVAGYEVLVIGGIALFMAGGMLIGYLPYTDRPGPGWYGPGKTIHELPMVWQWLRISLWGPIIHSAIIFALVKPLSLIPKLPRIVVRIVGTLLAGAAALLWVLATEWYFALALSVQWAALLLAAAYGIWLLPKVVYEKFTHAT